MDLNQVDDYSDGGDGNKLAHTNLKLLFTM